MIMTMLTELLKIVIHMFDGRGCDLYIPHRKPHVKPHVVLDDIF